MREPKKSFELEAADSRTNLPVTFPTVVKKGVCINRNNKELHGLYFSANIITISKKRK